MEDLESMRRRAAVDGALARAPGGPVTMLDPRPLVKVRVVYGRAVATTATHVLWEWVRWGEYHCRWDVHAQVVKVAPEDWAGGGDLEPVSVSESLAHPMATFSPSAKVMATVGPIESSTDTKKSPP